MSAPKVNTISVEAFKKIWDDQINVALVDVRELDEWNQVHIPGAIHIPKDDIHDRIEVKIPERNRPIYLHCLGGVRSLYAADTLVKLGYEQVFSIDGGITAWAEAGYPVK